MYSLFSTFTATQEKRIYSAMATQGVRMIDSRRGSFHVYLIRTLICFAMRIAPSQSKNPKSPPHVS